MEPTDIVAVSATTSGPASTWRPVWRFAGVLTLRLVLALVLGGMFVVPAMMRGLIAASPPRIQSSIDGLLPPLLAWLVAATFIGAALPAARALRSSSGDTRVRAAWCCVLVSALLGIAVHVIAADRIPRVAPIRAAGLLAAPRAAEFPPFLLTNTELAAVQTYFRAQGGYSQAVALVQELRLWSACLVPLFGITVATGVASADRARQGLRLFALQVAACVGMTVGVGLAIGPTMFVRPSRGPQDAAWILLVLSSSAAIWSLRRAVRDAQTRPDGSEV